MEQYTEAIMKWIWEYGPMILTALVIFIVGRIVVGMIVSLLKKVMGKANVDETLTKFIASLVRIFLLMVVVIAALEALGVNTNSMIAILGAAGLAIGLALQSSLSNFSSGVMLIIFRPFKAGDFIEAGGAVGVVEEIRIFNTLMKTGDNKSIIIPNGNIMGNNITNYSAKETRRVDMVFGIGYDDDLKKAKNLLEKIVSEDSRVLQDPAPVIAVSELADSSVNFIVRPWVKSADYWGLYWDFMEKVKITFDAEGISIPYPQQDVHMHQADNNNN